MSDIYVAVENEIDIVVAVDGGTPIEATITAPTSIIYAATARDGASAYQIWLAEGNVGTEQDFLDSLKGDPATNLVTSVATRIGDVLLNKSDVGLASVDNTADMDKPVSTPMENALFTKVDKVLGKGLSTLDYLPEERAKVAALEGINTGDQSWGDIPGDINTQTDLRNILNIFDGNGVVSGMVLSINTDNTKFDISSGIFYHIGSTSVPFLGVIAATVANLSTSNVTYVAIRMSDYAVIQQTVPFTATQRRTHILLGAVVHSDRTYINAINNLPDVALASLAQLNDLLDGIRSFNVIGNVFTPNGANLFLNKSEGTIFKKGVNFSTDVANPHSKLLPALVAPSNMRYRLSTGTEYPDTNAISMFYESAPGVRTALPGNRYTIQRVSIFSSNLVRIQYGQAVYNTLSAAKQAILTETFVTESNILENGLLRCYVIVSGSTTALNNVADAAFFYPDRFGDIPVGASGGTTNLQQAYANSETPEIITTTAGGALSIRRGSAADTDAVIETQDAAGNVTSRMNGTGTIVLPKTSGQGMKVDPITPTFGWRDLIGDVVPDPVGADAPSLSVFRGGLVREMAYSAGDKVDTRFHIPHDLVPGSDLFLHVHWAHNGTAISGNIVMTFGYTYANGHGQQIFPVEKTITITYPTVNIATTPRWMHRIEEIQLSSATPNASQLLSSGIEVDGLLLINMTMTTIPTITGGAPNEPFVMYVDLHYQSTNMPTKQKAPNFYV